MAMLKKNIMVLIIILLTIGLVLLVIWVYDQRIQHLEKTISGTKNMSALPSLIPSTAKNYIAL